MIWFIQFKKSCGRVYHIARDDIVTRGTLVRDSEARCSNNWARDSMGDTISTEVPTGKLCKRCRESYVKKHGEEDLFMAMI